MKNTRETRRKKSKVSEVLHTLEQKCFIFEEKSPFKSVTRDQVLGVDYLLAQIDPIIETVKNFDLKKNPKSYLKQGLIFSGPSGIGKTWLACYVATVSNVRIVYANDFPVEHKDEWSRENIQALFQLSRLYVEKTGKAIIIFWDQIEVLFDDNLNALSQLYEELDGVRSESSGVVFIGATVESPDHFDEQLVRPGRLSEIVRFEYPTKLGRASLLHYYLNLVPCEDIDVESLAELIPEKTPAEIKYLTVKTRDIANAQSPKQKKTFLATKKNVVDALIQNFLGYPGAKANETSKDSLLKLAVHEMGHAITAWCLGGSVNAVSLLLQRENLGETAYIFTDDVDIPSGAEIVNRISALYGSIVAEIIFGFSTGDGCRGDILQATKSIRNLVYWYGYGKKVREIYGLIAPPEDSASEKMKKIIESDIGNIARKAEKKAKSIMKGVGKRKLIALARVLVEERVILRDEFEKLMKQHDIKRLKATPVLIF